MSRRPGWKQQLWTSDAANAAKQQPRTGQQERFPLREVQAITNAFLSGSQRPTSSLFSRQSIKPLTSECDDLLAGELGPLECRPSGTRLDASGGRGAASGQLYTKQHRPSALSLVVAVLIVIGCHVYTDS